MDRFLSQVPPELAGLPTWALNGLSVGSLVMFIIVGLGSSRLWTKRQVDIVREDHTQAIATVTKQHDREVENLKVRYESHIERTIEQYRDRVIEAVHREEQWRDAAVKWQQVAELLSSGIEPMQEQSAATLQILQAWQMASTQRLPRGRS